MKPVEDVDLVSLALSGLEFHAVPLGRGGNRNQKSLFFPFSFPLNSNIIHGDVSASPG